MNKGFFKEFHRLYVAELLPITTKQTLQNFYSKYGMVRDLTLLRNKITNRLTGDAYV